MAGGDQRPGIQASHQGQVVRRHRTQAGDALRQLVLAQRRHYGARVVEQIPHTGHRRCGVATVLVLGRADHHAVGAWHHINLTSMHPSPNYSLRQRHTPLPPTQPQHFTLHRPNRQTRPQGRGIDSVGDHDRVGMHRVQIGNRPVPVDAQLFARRRQPVEQHAVVHRELGGRPEPMPNALRQHRFHIAHRRFPDHWMPLRGQPVGDRAQVGDVGTVDRDHQGLPRGDHLAG